MRHIRVGTALIVTASLGLAACGSESESLPVIRLGSGGQDRSGAPNMAASDAAVESVGSGDAAKMSMMAWVEYELGADLPPLDGEAEAWVLRSDVDEARVTELAAVLGVEGEVVEQPADMGGGWTVGATDGSTSSLWVYADGTGSWSYSAAWDESQAGWSCPEIAVDPPVEGSDVTAASDGGSGTDSAPSDSDSGSGVIGDEGDQSVVECVEPEPPQNVPTAEEAEALFVELLVQVGVATDGLEIEPYADEWGAWVNATREIDGKPTPLGWSASFGENAEMTYASGSFGEPESIGAVPRIGTDAAFDRLTSDEGWWGGWSGAYSPLARSADAGAAVATDEAVVADTAVPADAAVPTDTAATMGTVVVDPMPEGPEPIVVTIVDVEESLWSVWDVDGTVWLVPAYDFVDADGGRVTVPAVPDEMIQTEPEPVSPDAPETEAPAPVDTAVAPSVDPGPTPESVPMPEFPGGAESLVGLPEADATSAVEAAGFVVRITARDGEYFPATADYRLDRVNLEITDGVVTTASIG